MNSTTARRTPTISERPRNCGRHFFRFFHKALVHDLDSLLSFVFLPESAGNAGRHFGEERFSSSCFCSASSRPGPIRKSLIVASDADRNFRLASSLPQRSSISVTWRSISRWTTAFRSCFGLRFEYFRFTNLRQSAINGISDISSNVTSPSFMASSVSCAS